MLAKISKLSNNLLACKYSIAYIASGYSRHPHLTTDQRWSGTKEIADGPRSHLFALTPKNTN